MLKRLTAATACLLFIGACSTESDPTVSVVDTWVKASDEHMTSAFGTISYDGDEPAVIVSVTSPAAERVELHETVTGTDGEMSMQEISGGFTIEARGNLVLEPGGNHLMLMGMTEPIEAGDEVEFTATLDDGDTFTFSAIAKDYDGANESYHDSDE